MLAFFSEMTDGGMLVYEDVRKFGTMELLEKGSSGVYFAVRKLGPEPTEADFLLAPLPQLGSFQEAHQTLFARADLIVGLGNLCR